MPRTGTGRVYQRGNVWWIQYGFRGEDIRESSKSEKKPDANKLLKRRLGEMGRGKLVGPSEERVTFEELLRGLEQDYEVNGRASARRLTPALLHLRDYFGLSPALAVTTDRIRAYIIHRQKEGAAAASISIELGFLKRAFNLMVQGGQLTSRPYIPSVQVNNTREG